MGGPAEKHFREQNIFFEDFSWAADTHTRMAACTHYECLHLHASLLNVGNGYGAQRKRANEEQIHVRLQKNKAHWYSARGEN